MFAEKRKRDTNTDADKLGAWFKRKGQAGLALGLEVKGDWPRAATRRDLEVPPRRHGRRIAAGDGSARASTLRLLTRARTE